MTDNIYQNDLLFRLSRIMIIVNLLLFVSCSGPSNQETEYIDVYFSKGYIDSDGPCERDFSVNEITDNGRTYVTQEEYKEIVKHMDELKETENPGFSYGMCLQANFHFSDRNSTRLSFGQFGEISAQSKSFLREERLVYLLRKYTGFYNYYRRDEVMKFCKELYKFGLPENYQDQTIDLDSSSVFYARVRILPRQ